MTPRMESNHPIQSTIYAIWFAGMITASNLAGVDSSCHDISRDYRLPEVIPYAEASQNKTYDVEMFRNLNKIEEMSTFKEGWDGQHARAFSNEHLNLLKTIIRNLIWQPDIAPTTAGGLVIQYRDGVKRLAYNIEEKRTERVFSFDGDLRTAECRTLDTDESLCFDINDYAEKIYG